MDEEAKIETAALVYRYLHARASFRESKLSRASAGQRVTPETPAEDLGQGRRLLADGVLVYPQASLPVVGDDLDPDFLAAIAGRDDSIQIETAQLENLRSYVLRGGDLPAKRQQQRETTETTDG
jgi:hypothetical protein